MEFLLDESFADRILEVGNFVPAISIEGFEEETDMRRGKGTYRAVLRAMDILRERRLPFGFSACYHRENTSVIGSEQFFDEMIDRGCLFGWLFTYMPVGRHAVPELMATAEQREFMYRSVREFRRTKPLFTLDFWNDGDYVEGCIAGGRCYLHINAAGDVEPCAFIHYADSNIKEKSLLEALKSPLFMEYRKNQPSARTISVHALLLDNPGCLASMVHLRGAPSTEFSAPEDVDVPRLLEMYPGCNSLGTWQHGNLQRKNFRASLSLRRQKRLQEKRKDCKSITACQYCAHQRGLPKGVLPFSSGYVFFSPARRRAGVFLNHKNTTVHPPKILNCSSLTELSPMTFIPFL